jgi:hypothetical protein
MSASRRRGPREGGRNGRTGPGRVATRGQTDAELILGSDEASLLDIVDNVLSKGVVLTGEVTIALAHVDLVYARLSLLLCAADRVMPGESGNPITRRSVRHAVRERATRAQRRRG